MWKTESKDTIEFYKNKYRIEKEMNQLARDIQQNKDDPKKFVTDKSINFAQSTPVSHTSLFDSSCSPSSTICDDQFGISSDFSQNFANIGIAQSFSIPPNLFEGCSEQLERVCDLDYLADFKLPNGFDTNCNFSDLDFLGLNSNVFSPQAIDFSVYQNPENVFTL
ncbi:hypothetical protein AYI68_g767 [Smittium mucronatum]|uniref:Uncharacterized protein n=1 Tax=Smittium mucronatum TaxID=133383 RepID=A0A1R0H7A0_9FUNG|nr:hypothetical protein AYI68_g767 [Smittium mucronatum]